MFFLVGGGVGVFASFCVGQAMMMIQIQAAHPPHLQGTDRAAAGQDLQTRGPWGFPALAASRGLRGHQGWQDGGALP